MVFPGPVVAAEGAARLDLLAPQRSGVENEPASPGRVHDGNFIIDFEAQAESPLCLCSPLHRLRYRPHLQFGTPDALGHNDLSSGPNIGQIVDGLHIVHEYGVIAPSQPLDKFGNLHAGPYLF